MNNDLTKVCFVVAASLTICGVYAASIPKQPATIASPAKAGYVSLDYIVEFEDVKVLSPAMKQATLLLRSGRYQEAVVAFQAVQRVSPNEELAYRGEDEASRQLNTLGTTVARDQRLLLTAEAQTRPKTNDYVATLHYALGDALMLEGYINSIGAPPHDLGPEPRQQFLEAIRLKPNLLVAHLALAAYYEHDSQRHGTAARHEYDVSLQIRPDLYQIRYLHAASWDRPGYVINVSQLQANGINLSNDEKMIPEKAIAECLRLVQDYPNYPPPYYRLGSDYAFPLHDYTNAKRYLSVYTKIGDPTLEWWRYATAEVRTIDESQASKPR